jgi:hypothetical protein
MGRDRHQAKKLLVLAAVGLMLAAGVWGAAAAANANGSKPALGEASAFWKRCSFQVRVWQFEISPVEVLHTTCGAARHVIERGHVLESPGGPIFSTRGYACRSRAILPPVDPSPARLPAAEFCRRGTRRISFVWDYAS